MNKPSETARQVPKRSVSRPEKTLLEPLNQTSIPTVLCIMATVSSLLLLLVGGSLFLFPGLIQSQWVWALTPFNTRFLGAIYLTALVALLSLLLPRRLTLVRLILPMTWMFTMVVLMASCFQLSQFDVNRRATNIWFLLYLVDCIIASYYLGRYRQQTVRNLHCLSSPWSVYLQLQSSILGIYGAGLFLFPGVFGSPWPWPLDLFHTQLYSAVFLTGAVGAWVVSRHGNHAELRALGILQLVFSSLVILGVGMVDSVVHKINWGLASNWIWIGAIAFLGILGIGLIKQAAQLRKN